MKENRSPKCPYCGHRGSTINRREPWDDTVRCYRVCTSCTRRYTTIEVPVEFQGGTYVPFGQEVAQRVPAKPSTSFRRVVMPPDTWGLPYQLAMDITHWWEVARWGKHGNKAVWTERAFTASLERVKQLHAVQPDRARELVQQGVEKGWQGLDPKYLQPTGPVPRSAPTQATPLGPVSPTMQAAVESWQDSP